MHSPASCCLSTGPGYYRAVYDPRIAAEGPRSVNLHVFQNAGPAVLLMGPIQHTLHPHQSLLTEDVGYYIL